MFYIVTGLGLTVITAIGANAASLGAYNVDPNSVSVSGFSSGGFMAAQLGVAYSNTFKTGFGVFAGGPYDCARNQQYTSCMYNGNPSITTPTANMRSWSGNQIDAVANLQSRKIYMQVGPSDTTVGPNVMSQLKQQLANFGTSSNTVYVTTNGASHTFPTDYSYIIFEASNCGYDGAGAVLQWMYGSLQARNTGTLSGSVVSFSQAGSYGASGMATTGYLYVPQACQSGSTVCKLHVALHGCLQSYGSVQSKFIDNTGYNKWADTNNIIILFPQAVADSTSRTIWDGSMLSNSNGCWDWLGWYGQNADQKGGVQMAALVNQVNQIISAYNAGGSTPPPTGTTTSTTSSTAPASATPAAALYGQCDQTPELSGLLDGLSEEDEDLQGLTTEAWAGYVAAEAKGLEIIARLLENRRTRVEAAVQTIKADV
ncbi:hypothetical protein V491_06038 [Pseudogymnoascus sp. VKM F-3775]|nr:hypothetical protein V491_06038 [Pseudogymnoascus sp. VKM F-3775]